MRDERGPEDAAADYYLAHKGYPDARPVRKYEAEPGRCWYFYYVLPDGDLELEVSWDGGWDFAVAFRPGGEPSAAPRSHSPSALSR